MSKKYREIKIKPEELGHLADNFKLFVVNIGNRVANKLDISRVKSLAAH